jgi:tetratricopeptide (TPR) repeat protein
MDDLQQAIRLQAQGKLAQATKLYGRILSADPENVDVLIRLGITFAQAQDPERAVVVFEAALALDDRRADAHNNLGNVMVALGRLEEAAEAYQRALALAPGYADANSKLGHAFVKLGRFEEAVTSFRQAAAITPGSANDQKTLADALLALKRFEEAEAHYRAVLEIAPRHAVARTNLGMVLQKLGRLDDALAHCAQAIAIRPDYGVGHRNMGTVLRKLGRLNEAVDCFRKALEIDADDVDAHYNLGNVQQDLGRFTEAESSYRQVLAIRPEFVSAHNNLGNVLLNLRRYAEAESHYRQALAIAPDHLNANSNLAVCLLRLGRQEDAMAHCRRILAVRPDHADAHVNLGAGLFDLGRLDEAADHYRQALDTNSDHADAHWNNALLNLSQGDFETGWAQYEWRWQAQQMPPARQLAKPVWRGDELAGRRLLLHAEQGFGDTIQFSRYATMLVERGADILFEVPRSLGRLMAGLAGRPDILSRGDALPPFDCHIPLMSLPHILGTRLDTVPAAVPYLAAEPERTKAWRRILGDDPAMKIGIVWQGNPANLADRGRSMPLLAYRPLAALAGVRLISLQHTDGIDQLAKRPADMKVQDFSDRLDIGTDAFLDTAALMMSLDLVITTDTAVAHLAGALGRPTWILLKRHSDWRWLLDRTDCPWYPTARLYRQSEPGDWQSVIERVASDLAGA